MIAKFRYHSEKMCIAKFRRDCKIFAMHSKNPAFPALPPATSSASISSIPLDISSTRLDGIAENSYEHGINRHQLEAKVEMMAEAHKTCKITKNKLKTKSVALNGPAHVNWLNSYD